MLGRTYVAPPQIDQGERLVTRGRDRIHAQGRQHDTDSRECVRWRRIAAIRNTPEWYKSSYSGGSGGDCLEMADGHRTLIPVRDSKNPEGPKLVFRATAWAAFVENLKDERA